MKWITRERPKIDRIACPWLITRFIENDAEFLYVPADDVFRIAEQTGAIPYDIPGAELSHVGELCSFDAFFTEIQLDRSSFASARCDCTWSGYFTIKPDTTIGWSLRHLARIIVLLQQRS